MTATETFGAANELLRRCQDALGLEQIIEAVVATAVSTFDADTVILRLRDPASHQSTARKSSTAEVDPTAHTTIATRDHVQLAAPSDGPHTELLPAHVQLFDRSSLRFDRWRSFAAVAAARNWRSCRAVALEHAGVAVANLVVSSTTAPESEPTLGPKAESAAVTVFAAFASAAAVVIGQAVLTNEAERRAAHLERALVERLVVEQAKGFVAAIRRIDPDEAFDLIRRTARSSNSNLHELCRALLDGRRAVPTVVAQGRPHR